MPARTPRDAAEALNELADLEDLRGETFKARAYRRAARSIGQLEGDLDDALAKGQVKAIEGVGESILKKVQEFAKTGNIAKLDKLRTELPKGLAELVRIPGLGPKRAIALYQELKIDSVAKLKQACERHQLALVKGFGAKLEQDILKGIAALQEGGGQRLLLPEAQRIADEVAQALKPHAAQVEAAGSLRRRKDTVGDLDFVAVARKDREALQRALLSRDGAEPLAQGERKTSVRLSNGVQVDLRVMEAEEFGAAMLYFTGSKAHNIRLRGMALKKGWRLNEYGLFEGTEEGGKGKRLAGKSEEEVFAKLGLPYVDPELREDAGEVEAALEGKLPKLIRRSDLQGDLHNHSSKSDGILSPEQWVKAAAKCGLRYVGLTDHSIGLPGWGMTGEQLLEHKAKVLELADEHAGKVKVFVGAEANILKDGELDLPASVLDQLDYVVAGVHTHFQMRPAEMTKRIVKALRDGRIDILSHPTGRKIGQRNALDFDRDGVFKAAAESRTCLELDGQPDRLDLNGELARRAKELGCRFAVDSDGHGEPGSEFVRWALDQARRGWLEKGDVVNTLPPGEVLKALKRR